MSDTNSFDKIQVRKLAAANNDFLTISFQKRHKKALARCYRAPRSDCVNSMKKLHRFARYSAATVSSSTSGTVSSNRPVPIRYHSSLQAT